MRLAVIPLTLYVVVTISLELLAQGVPAYELPPILYSETSPSNRVEVLQRRLDAGDPLLAGADAKETLRLCLAALDVSSDTQVLVFSKTSLQRNRIHPGNPRALFFSDDCYVGWVPGGLLEVAVTDPLLGLVFYRFDPRPRSRTHRFERDEECLSCHAGPLTRQWPALIVRSVFPDSNGEPVGRAGSFLTDHTSLLSERWGGWYVTGNHGAARHMGNVTLISSDQPQDFELDRESGANVNHLDRWVSTDQHLRHDSDIVALMVLEHQVTLHNRLAEGALRVRRWMHYQKALQRELGETVSDHPTGTALKVIESETRRILSALLFSDEARLPDGGIRGHSQFKSAFYSKRRFDAKDRSLKDLNLDTRLFQYRCSYLIHSDAFAHLPTALKDSIYRALQGGLMSDTQEPPFDHLELSERVAIREILDATQPEWRGE
jgi:hypothetical protein